MSSYRSCESKPLLAQLQLLKGLLSQPPSKCNTHSTIHLHHHEVLKDPDLDTEKKNTLKNSLRTNKGLVYLAYIRMQHSSLNLFDCNLIGCFFPKMK